MVGAVIPPNRLAAIGQPEVLVAVAPGDHQVIGLGDEVGGGSVVGGVPPLESSVSSIGCTAAL